MSEFELDDLEQELKDCLEVIGKLDPASEEYTTAVRNYEILNECKIKKERIEADRYIAELNYSANDTKNDIEKELNQIRKDDARKDRILNGVKIASVVLLSGGVAILTIVGENSMVVKSKVGIIAGKIINLL